MSYTSASGRRRILEETAAVADQLNTALAILGDAFDQLDEHAAEEVEDTVFKPLQAAYGLLRRTHTEFAERFGIAPSTFAAGAPGLPSGARAMLEQVGDAAQTADDLLAELQDSLLPVEVGDEPLRTGLSRVRTLLDRVPAASDALIRTLGR